MRYRASSDYYPHTEKLHPVDIEDAAVIGLSERPSSLYHDTPHRGQLEEIEARQENTMRAIGRLLEILMENGRLSEVEVKAILALEHFEAVPD